MYLASGLLLFDNLCVLWWYADSTKQQLALAQAEFKESQRERLIFREPGFNQALGHEADRGEADATRSRPTKSRISLATNTWARVRPVTSTMMLRAWSLRRL